MEKMTYIRQILKERNYKLPVFENNFQQIAKLQQHTYFLKLLYIVYSETWGKIILQMMAALATTQFKIEKKEKTVAVYNFFYKSTTQPSRTKTT